MQHRKAVIWGALILLLAAGAWLQFQNRPVAVSLAAAMRLRVVDALRRV